MEPDDVIEEDPETVVGSPDDALIVHEFERSLENAFAEKAVIVLTLDRRTGDVQIDYSLSNVMEAWATCNTAETMLNAYLDDKPVLPLAGQWADDDED